ncbi:MAG TPA: Ig-like domain-containing protein [Thermoanaerobaculia bacterium]|nr:Ig-like domain-containing protein [Thermoanaerobaculia bacterium]
MRISKLVQLFFVLLTLTALVPQRAEAQCKVNEPGFSAGDRLDDLTTNLMDFGRIHVDADLGSDDCALQALYALTAKLQTLHTNYPAHFSKSFAGGEVSLIFAAALRLGDRGLATKDLHTQLVFVLNGYTGANNPDCGLDTLRQANTCFDDYTIAASGYAWIAAYEARRGTSLFAPQIVTNAQQAARNSIDTGFKLVCIHNPLTYDQYNLCNGSVENLLHNTGNTATDARTLSLNHGANGNNGKQEIAYGFGLLTSVSSALLGLDASGPGVMLGLSADEQTIAKALATEAELHITSGEFNADCWEVTRTSTDSKWVITATPCAGEALATATSPYHPDMYQLGASVMNPDEDAFFNKYVGKGSFPTAGTYRSNSFNEAFFALTPTSDGTGPSNEPGKGPFSFGRLVTYRDHGYDWLIHPRQYLPPDTVDPIGYVDGIDGNGSAYGWTCDQDVPTKAVRVDFLDSATSTNYGFVRANLASEAAINSQCGGTAHRFTFTLPPATSGRAIRAYAIDYTYFGYYILPCSTGGTACYTWSDTILPLTTITAPGEGAILTGIVSVSASASDNVGVINKVEFYLDGILASTDTIAPYLWNFDTATATNGAHTLTSKAYDLALNVGTSPLVNVTVDTKVPTTTITAPANGTTVAGTTTVTATASDNSAVARVEFYLDGGLGFSTTTSPYFWNWNTNAAATGTHTLTSKAYDTAGNIGISAGISVTVNNTDTTAPTTAITAPTNGTGVAGTTTVTATASDNNTVARVEFYLDGGLANTDTTAPWAWSWNVTASPGAHTLMSKAYDAANNVGASTAVSVTVGDTIAPTAPSNLGFNITYVSRQLKIQWMASTDNVGVAGYQIWHATSALGPFTKITTNDPAYTFFVQSYLALGSVHYYYVKAVDAAGNLSPASNTVHATVIY